MLTDLKIKRMTKPLKNEKHSDRDGLELHNRKSGRKIFVFRFQWDKKPQSLTIGRYPSLSLAKARQIALSYRSMIDEGIDPRDQLRTSKRTITTLATVAEAWFEKNKKGWRDSTLKLHMRGLYRDIIPVAGNIPIDEVSRSDILRIIRPHEELDHLEIAHRLYTRLKAIFDYAVAAGITENYPLNGLKKALAPKPKINNHVSIHPKEAHTMLQAIKSSDFNSISKLYIELLAHLFVRPSELRLAEWVEFDLSQSEWNIPASRMKMDEPHWVPLSNRAIELLEEIKIITGNTPFVFCSPVSSPHKPISETCARSVLHKLGYKDRHCLHGFRSLASTILNSETRFRADAIEAQQARKVAGVRGIYMRADFKSERREIMSWYSNWLVNRI